MPNQSGLQRSNAERASLTDGCHVFVIYGSCRKRWESFFLVTLRRIKY